MNFEWIELPAGSQEVPYRMPAGMRSGLLPRDARFRPVVGVVETHFRPGGRVETRPAGVARPPGSRTFTTATSTAFAMAVSFIGDRVNQSTLEQAITDALWKKSSIVERIMSNHRTGGLLAVANVITRFDPSSSIGVSAPGTQPAHSYGPQWARLGGLSIEGGVYSLPGHALSVWRHTPRLEAGPAREGEYVTHRFYWGSRPV